MTRTASKPAANDAVTSDQAARFAAEIERLWPGGGKLGLAVSGGPDSLALLLLADAAIQGRIAVATVDHGLRPEAAEECEMVARICAERNNPDKIKIILLKIEVFIGKSCIGDRCFIEECRRFLVAQ